MSAQNNQIVMIKKSVTMATNKLTPLLGITFFVIVGVSAAVWLWSAILIFS